MRALLDGIRLALRAIVRSPLRASLTVLGILIGISAVVTVTALGTGARENIAQQIQSIGTNFIIIFPQSAAVSGAHGAQGSGVRLTEDDGRAILQEGTSVVAIAPALRSLGQVVSGDQNCSTQLIGTTLSYLQVRNWPVDKGVEWQPQDELIKTKVVILGATVVRKLFGSDDPVGHLVRIGRYPYRVVGVLAQKGDAPFGGDQDDIVLMPSSTFRAHVMKTPPGFAGALMASASSADTTDRAVAQMGDLVYGFVTNLLIGVAAVSLIVGGIGIMNIMLVSVTERTREIGIRMA